MQEDDTDELRSRVISTNNTSLKWSEQIESRVVDWIPPAYDRVQWQAFVKTEVKRSGFVKRGKSF
jgi:hypothetical protein